MDSLLYYILTTEWYDSGNKNIIKLFVTGPSGNAEILISNKPVFFIKSEFQEEIPLSYKRKKVELSSFSGEPLDAVYFNTQAYLKKIASLFEEKNVTTFEADIDPVRRFLMEKSIFGSIKVSGHPDIGQGKTVFVNPFIEAHNYYPDLVIASIDIETEGRGTRLYSIGIHVTGKGKDIRKVLMVGEQENTAETIFFKSEKELLSNFLIFLSLEDPDVITGWHVIGFDLMFLEKKYNEHRLKFNLGRGESSVFLKMRRGGGYFASVQGRIIIDAPTVLRSHFYSFEDFKLETVARELLGEGKIIPPGADKVKTIDDYFRNNKLKLAEYNLKDAVLVTSIIRKTGLLDLLIKRSIISGLVIDQVGMMTAAFDHVFLPQFHKKGYAAPDIKDIRGVEHAAGGYVMDPDPGIYENVIVLDFKSLYPSIIMTFKIDPLSRLKSSVNPLSTPTGIKFSSTENILPEFIKELMMKREEARKKKDKPLSTAIKLLMNSFYGVMGSYGCRFYHPDLPGAITGTGQWLLIGSKSYLEARGYKVIYGDTDSLFVKLRENDNDPDAAGERLATLLNEYWLNELKEKFNADSHLEIEYEKHYRKFIITPARRSEAGAKKRYAGLLVKEDREVLEFTGMESIRSDWTKLAKEFQAELYKRVFSEDEIDDWIRSFIVSVRKGEMDDKLIYKKRIRKDISEYKNLPPQIRAARMQALSSSSIRYVITLRGPVPVEMKHNDIDYQHYIDKQLKPIADSVLILLGKSFDSIINPFQLDFFDS